MTVALRLPTRGFELALISSVEPSSLVIDTPSYDRILFCHPWFVSWVRGMKLGIYLNNGRFTCQHFAGSEGHLAEDVAKIASWGVDGLKLDGCYM